MPEEAPGFNALARDHTSDPQANVDDVLSKLQEPDRSRDEQGRFAKETEPEAPQEAAEEPESEPVEVEADAEEDPAPDEDQSSGEEEEQDDEPDETPPIEMPVSWSADDAEVWNALTPDAQEKVLERETARDTEVRRLQNETAEKRKGTDAELEALQTERRSLAETLSQISAFANTLDPVIQEGNATDWAKLVEEEGSDVALARKARYDERVNFYNSVGQELQNLQRSHYEQNKTLQQKSLLERLPELAEEGKRDALKRDSLSVLQDYGYSTEEANAFWDEMPDARHAQLVRDAVELRKIKAAQKSIVEKKAPKTPKKVIKPKAQQNPQDADKTRTDALRKQVRQDGPRNVNLDALTELAQREVRSST